MSFPNLIFTDEGKSLQLKAMNGDSITFTKVEIGNGEEPKNISKLTQLNNKLYVCGITYFEINNGYATIHWSLDSMAVTSEFDWTEYGIFAKDSFNNEILYAYAYDSVPQTIPSADSSSITQIEADINIAIGDAENVNAIIGEYSAYASKEVVSDHINNVENPHNVTKSQIGLGNVDNVSTNDASPTFTASTALSEINSGETATNLWGKVKTAIKAFIEHKNDKNNPHGITLDKIGAAARSHTHSATDINSGILSVSRGGTGVSDLNSLLKKLITDGKQHIKLANGRYLRGLSTDGKEHTIIGLGTDNNIYIGNDESSYAHLHAKNSICIRTTASSNDGRYWFMNSIGALYPYKIVNSGNAQANTASTLGTSTRRVGTVYASNALNTSDAKLKENISDADVGFEILKRLSIVQFNFIGEKDIKCGVIAQEVFKLFQELDIHNSGVYQASLIYEEFDETIDKDGQTIRIPKIIPEFENLSDDEILKHSDSEITWNIDYDSLTYYCIAGFRKYMQITEQRISKLEDMIGGNM